MPAARCRARPAGAGWRLRDCPAIVDALRPATRWRKRTRRSRTRPCPTVARPDRTARRIVPCARRRSGSPAGLSGTPGPMARVDSFGTPWPPGTTPPARVESVAAARGRWALPARRCGPVRKPLPRNPRRAGRYRSASSTASRRADTRRSTRQDCGRAIRSVPAPSAKAFQPDWLHCRRSVRRTASALAKRVRRRRSGSPGPSRSTALRRTLPRVPGPA